MDFKKLLATGLATTSLLSGLPMIAQASEFQGEFPTETAIVSVVDVEDDDFTMTRLTGVRTVIRATAVLQSPGGAAFGNLPAGSRVQAMGQNGSFVLIRVISGGPTGAQGWVARSALQ